MGVANVGPGRLQEEIDRVKRVRDGVKGPSMSPALMSAAIELAKKAIASGDKRSMYRAYEDLKEWT